MWTNPTRESQRRMGKSWSPNGVENYLSICLHHRRVYVEIMHTNGYTLGLGAPLGQADFFPNFGRSQPGCGIDLTGSCAHGRAPEYFAESINSSKFIAKRCQTSQEIENNRCTVHGAEEIIMRPEPANYGLRGYFYLSTNAYTPFARGWGVVQTSCHRFYGEEIKGQNVESWKPQKRFLVLIFCDFCNFSLSLLITKGWERFKVYLLSKAWLNHFFVMVFIERSI